MRYRRHECMGGCWDEAKRRAWRGTAYEVWDWEAREMERAKRVVDDLRALLTNGEEG